MRIRIPQKNIRWLGVVMESLYSALPLLSIINFLSISVVLYTNIQGYLKDWAPWITFPIFLVVIFILTSITVLLTWMFLVPSLWTLRGQQMFGKEERGKEEGKILKYFCARCNEEVSPNTIHTCKDLMGERRDKKKEEE